MINVNLFPAFEDDKLEVIGMPNRSSRYYYTDGIFYSLIRHQDGAFSYRKGIVFGENLRLLAKEPGAFSNLFAEPVMLSPEERQIQGLSARVISRFPPGKVDALKFGKYLVFGKPKTLPEVVPVGPTLGKGSYLHTRLLPGGLVLQTLKKEKRDHARFLENHRTIVNLINPNGAASGIVTPPRSITYLKEGLLKPALLANAYLGDGKAYLKTREHLPTPRERVAECGQLFEALVLIHAHNIHHGDLKLGNLLYSERGPVISDFGGSGLGKPAEVETACFAPLRHSPRKYTLDDAFREDVHALGIIVLNIAGSVQKDPELSALISAMIIRDQENPSSMTANKALGMWLKYIKAKKKGGDPSPETRITAKLKQ